MNKPMSLEPTSSGLSKLGKVLRREPLVHFVALAALLFVLDHVWSSARKEKIVVDRQSAAFLIKQREDLSLRKLTPAERKQVIEVYIEDEILYREAYKRGLDKDARMRRNLILKMRGLELGKVKQKPTDAELRRYFEANRARYTRPPTVFFDQVYYRDPGKAPKDLLTKLRAGLNPETVGTSVLSWSRSIKDVSARNLALVLGPRAARAILALEDGRWHGPIVSRRGAHFVRITERRPAQQARFEDVERYLRGDWALAQSRLAIEKAVAKLRANYEIIVEADKPKP